MFWVEYFSNLEGEWVAGETPFVNIDNAKIDLKQNREAYPHFKWRLVEVIDA